MDKIERVRAALVGGPVDRVPAGFWFHFPASQATGEASVRAHLDYYRASGTDFLKIMNEHPYRAENPIQNASDWRHLRPAPLSSTFYRRQLDEIKAIVDGVGGECLAIATVFGPFASGNHAGSHLVSEHLKQDPQAVNQGLAAIAESLAEFSAACLDAGAAGIYYSAQGGEEDRFTEDQFLNYILPHDLTVLEAIQNQGEFNLLHICKDNVRLHLYAGCPAHAVNWAATKNNPGIEAGREIFKRTILGGMDDRGVMAYGPLEGIHHEVRRVIQSFGQQGFILGADCTLPTDVPLENIRAAVEATEL